MPRSSHRCPACNNPLTYIVEENEFAKVLMSVRKSPLRWRLIQWIKHKAWRVRVIVKQLPPPF